MEQLADGRYDKWQFIDRGFETRIDGGDPNSFSNVILAHPTNPGTPIHAQLAFVKYSNRTSTSHVGVGVRIAKNEWVAGQWTHATTTYTADTTDFQSATTGDAALETTTINDGFLVAANCMFNALSIIVTTASTGSPVRTYEYSAAGGTWKTGPGAISFSAQTANWTGSGAENTLWMVSPADWVPLEAGHGTNVPVGKYGLRVRCTTAPSGAGVAACMSVHNIHLIQYSVPVLTSATQDYGGLYSPLELRGDAIVACTNFANSANSIQILARIRGL